MIYQITLCLFIISCLLLECRSEEQPILFDLPFGKVEGIKQHNYSLFRGLRYGAYQQRFEAASMVDDLRGPEGSTYDATRFGNACPQHSLLNTGRRSSEDCLFVNIWTPILQPSQKRDIPVMVFIHGGAYVHGSGDDLYIEGEQYAKKGFILVTFNYRLGLFGFFAHPEITELYPDAPTNFGLLDQIVALKWIKKYISLFGGNPNDITVFGESAGGSSIEWLLASKEHAKSPLFTKAVLQSPPCAAYAHDLRETEGLGASLAEQAGCSPGSVVQCLRNLTIAGLSKLTWSRRTFALPVSPLPYSPTRIASPHVDYINFVEHPSKLGILGDSATIKSHDIIIGTTLHEWMLFLWIHHLFMLPSDEWMHKSVDLVFSSEFFTSRNLTDLAPRLEKLYPPSAFKSGLLRVSAIYTDLVFFCPSKGYAKKLVEQGANVHFYLFSHEAAHGNQKLQAYHSAELPFVFQKATPPFLGGLLKLFPSEFTPEEISLSNDIIDAWTSLGKHKAGEFYFGNNTWPAFSPEGTNYMDLGIPSKLVEHFQDAQCEFWDEVLPSPHDTIQFDLMAHEPFLLTAVNGYTLVAGKFLQANAKPAFLIGIIVLILFTKRCCGSGKTRLKFIKTD